MSKPALTCYLEKMLQDQGNPLLSVQFRVPFDRITASDVEPESRNYSAARATGWNRSSRRMSRRRAFSPPASAPTTTRCARSTSSPSRSTMPWAWCATSSRRHIPGAARAFNAVQPDVSAFYTGIPLNAGLVAEHQVLRRDTAKPRAHRRPAPLSCARPWRPSAATAPTSTRRQEAAGRDRRRADAAHHEVLGERPRLHQRLRTGAHRTKPNSPACRRRARRCRARRAPSAKARQAGASPCRRPTTSP